MLTLKEVRKRQRAARKLMRLPENQEALRKGLERIKRVYGNSRRVAGPQKVVVADKKARSRKRKA